MDRTEARDFIARARWTFAKTVADIAPHEYCVVKDGQRGDVSEAAFWAFADLIRAEGREEIWTPPAEWVRRWPRSRQTDEEPLPVPGRSRLLADLRADADAEPGTRLRPAGDADAAAGARAGEPAGLTCRYRPGA